MEYKLKTPIKISTRTGEIIEANEIEIKVRGEEGGRLLKKLHSTFIKQTSKIIQSDSSKASAKEDIDATDKTKISVDEMMCQINFMPGSDLLYDDVMQIIKKFGWIAGHRLNKLYLDLIEVEDIDGLYDEVIKFFLLTKYVSDYNKIGAN